MIGHSTARLFRRKALMLLIVASLGVLAVPALAGAAPAPTSLGASSLYSTVTWGQFSIVTGILMDTSTSTALGGKFVRVEW